MSFYNLKPSEWEAATAKWEAATAKVVYSTEDRAEAARKPRPLLAAFAARTMEQLEQRIPRSGK